MQIQTWACDACGASLPSKPVLFVAIVESGTGAGYAQAPIDLCQPCMDRVLDVADPQRRYRERLKAGMSDGREPTFLVHGKG